MMAHPEGERNPLKANIGHMDILRCVFKNYVIVFQDDF